MRDQYRENACALCGDTDTEEDPCGCIICSLCGTRTRDEGAKPVLSGKDDMCCPTCWQRTANRREVSETFERKLSALKTLVDMMPKVPEMRRDVSKRANVRWLIRNLGIKSVEGVNENADHPLYRTTIDQLIWVEKNWEDE